ncbi:MAG: hypothetical protein IJA19_06590 [Clostridia bacterium]|nr:hypothetical protein [Clostridia bacterium]
MKKEKSKVLKYAKKVDRLAKLRNILSEVPKYAFISGGCIGLLGCVMMSQVLAVIGIGGILTAALVETFSLVITDTIVKSKWKTEEKVDKIDSEVLKNILLTVKVDVGPSTRWSELSTIESLDTLLKNNHITFDMYLELLPKNCGIPKDKILQMIKEKTPKIPANEDEVIGMLSEEERMAALKNPQVITDKLKQTLSVK